MFLNMIIEERITFNSQNSTDIVLLYKIEFFLPSLKIQRTQQRDHNNNNKKRNESFLRRIKLNKCYQCQIFSFVALPIKTLMKYFNCKMNENKKMRSKKWVR